MPSNITPPPTASAPQSLDQPSPNRLLILALILLGFALRLYHLGTESLWYDETVSAYLASEPLTDLIAHTARDIHPPGYYLLLHLWRAIAHPSVAFGLEYLYAWPSLWLSILVMALLYGIARRCFGTKAAYWALALAVVHPVQIWFAQEVRMYALGAFCLLLTLWAVSPYLIVRNPERLALPTLSYLPKQGLFLYPIAALAGLYTLYYFLFWLAILNLAMVVRLWKHGYALRSWIVLQILVVIGWLPWLPIFIRQAITPPVPGWRVPWQSAGEFFAALSEAMGSIWVGHTPPLLVTWPWAIFSTLIMSVTIGYAKKNQKDAIPIWLLLVFGAPILLLLVSLVGPPIYHVRYVSTYAPLVVIVTSLLLAKLRLPVAVPIFGFIAVVSALTLQQLWTNPLYAADDHRGAVAALSHQWRPGDAILVNAGWAYTALAVYWPTDLPAPTSSRPPSLAESIRLSQVTATSSTNVPILVRTGSVDGDPMLGWGLPASDFFAMTEAQTLDALALLAASHPTIWHYRLYDTVSDPNGAIRNWLAQNTQRFYSQPIAGRDYLLLEGYRTSAPRPTTNTSLAYTFPDAALSVRGVTIPAQLAAGETLYVNLAWQSTDSAPLPIVPSLSLRLYDAQGTFLLQSDTTVEVIPSGAMSQIAALPIPADTIPGDYTVSLVVYAPDTLEPYRAIAGDGTTAPFPLTLGNVVINLPTSIPHTPTPLASFDYIDLIAVDLPKTPLTLEGNLETTWTWRPRSSDYSDHYLAKVELVDTRAQRFPLADFTLGGDLYPSSQWPANYPVRQHLVTPLSSALPPGTYAVHLTLTRATDGATIPARLPWQFADQPAIDVGKIELVANQ